MPSFAFGDDQWAQLLVYVRVFSSKVSRLESLADQSGHFR